MGTIRRFEDIEAWQKARELAQTVYRLTSGGPFARDFALRHQVRRSAVSVMANIAEGFERDGNKEFARFLRVAKGSWGERRSHLWAAFDQRYLTGQQHSQACEAAAEVSRMLAGLRGHLRRSDTNGRKYR